MAETWTLQRFFYGNRGNVDGRTSSRLNRDKALDAMRQELKRHAGKVPWKLVAREVGKQIGRVLDVPIVDKILGPGWQKLDELQQYRSQAPGEKAIASLARHTVSSVHKPHIDLLWNQAELGRLDLVIDVALDLEGLLLHVEEGRIRQVGGGRCKGRGKLSCAYGEATILKLERSSRSFGLEGGLTIPGGIPIPDLSG